jgi:hypothetical protein
MVKIKKTGKSFEVEPYDIIRFATFLSCVMQWDIVNGYLSFSSDKSESVPLSSVRYNTLTICPKYILVPTNYFNLKYIIVPTCQFYDYYLEEVGRNLGIRIRPEDKIKVKKHFKFDEYELTGDFYGVRSKVEINVSISLNTGKGKATLDVVSIKVKSNTDFFDYYWPLYFYNDIGYTVRSRLEEGFIALKESNGKRCQDLEKESPASTIKIGYLENTMFLVINFLYSLYNGEFSMDTNEYKVLAPFIKLIRSYGENFEEVLETVKLYTKFALLL